MAPNQLATLKPGLDENQPEVTDTAVAPRSDVFKWQV